MFAKINILRAGSTISPEKMFESLSKIERATDQSKMLHALKTTSAITEPRAFFLPSLFGLVWHWAFLS